MRKIKFLNGIIMVSILLTACDVPVETASEFATTEKKELISTEDRQVETEELVKDNIESEGENKESEEERVQNEQELLNEYEEIIKDENGSEIIGFNIPSVVKEYNLEKLGEKSYFVDFESYGGSAYDNSPFYIRLYYFNDDEKMESARNIWDRLNSNLNSGYFDKVSDGVKYRYFICDHDTIKSDLGDFDYYNFKVADEDDMEYVDLPGYTTTELAFLDYGDGLLEVQKNVDIDEEDPLQNGTIKEFLPIMLNDKSYKESLAKEGSSALENSKALEEKDLSLAEAKIDDNANYEKTKSDTESDKLPEQAEKSDINDGVTHTYIFNETGFAMNGVLMPTTVTITTTGSKPTAGATISVSGLNASVAFAELDVSGNQSDAPTIDTNAITYTIKSGTTNSLMIWLEPWADSSGAGFEEMIKWNPDGSMIAMYSPENFAQIN